MSDDVQTKICELRSCRSEFARRHGESDAKWAVRRFCQPKCAIEFRGKEHKTKIPDSQDAPVHPVPVGQTWRPVGFAPTPDSSPRPGRRVYTPEPV